MAEPPDRLEPYPWESDEVIYSIIPTDFDPEKESWIALAVLEEKSVIAGHRNTHRLVFYSPLHGLTSHLVNGNDLQHLLTAAIVGLKRERNPSRDNWEYYFRKAEVGL